MDHHWAITSASGRRVSLLCDDDNDYSYSSASSPNSAPTPPLSPDHRRNRPQRAYSMESSISSTSSVRSNSYSPPTPPSFGLPPLEKLLPVPDGHYFPRLSSRSNSFSTSSLSPLCSTIEENVIVAPSRASSIASISNPPSPKSSSAASPVIKRSSRRYTCQCGKSFTTSGHLARHTRIHTGEKNYICPEPECGARFSRQDNCMQHYRTHQSGSASKRAARRRRMSVDDSVSISSKSLPQRELAAPAVAAPPHLHQRAMSYPQPPHSYQPSQSFGSESGLAALASVAIASYT